MEVKEFVSATIIEIIEGVCMAQEYAAKHGAVVNAGPVSGGWSQPEDYMDAYVLAEPQEISFDLQVTEQDSIEANHKVAVVFAPIGGGANSKDNSSTISANRVSFSVSVAFPKQKSS
jgi:hypothetical protein